MRNTGTCTVCTCIIMVCVVCAVLTEHRGILLVRAQCGYMLSHDSLVNGVQSTGARWGRTKLWHGATRRVKCARGILARDTKIVCNRY
jgi:hypothetical protein